MSNTEISCVIFRILRYYRSAKYGNHMENSKRCISDGEDASVFDALPKQQVMPPLWHLHRSTHLSSQQGVNYRVSQVWYALNNICNISIYHILFSCHIHPTVPANDDRFQCQNTCLRQF